jgi:hypothetical protein
MKYISNRSLSDGMGSRVCKLLNLIGYSLLIKDNVPFGIDRSKIKEFVYTPFSCDLGNEFHCNPIKLYAPFRNSSKIAYLEMCQEWETMLGYKGKTIYEVNPHDIEFLVHPPMDTNSVLLFTGSKRKQIKSMFSIKTKLPSDLINVAIHIRRGDVTEDMNQDRYVGYDHYLRAIEIITRNLGSRCKITIFTQRSGFNHDLFSSVEIKYDDENRDSDSWLELVNADILVIGRSSYSYSAGLLNDNTVVYTDMFHPKMLHWIYLDGLEGVISRTFDVS